MSLHHGRRYDAGGDRFTAILQKDGVSRRGSVTTAEELMEGAKRTVALGLDADDYGVGVNRMHRVISDKDSARRGAVESDGAAGREAKYVREIPEGVLLRACLSAVRAVRLGGDQGKEKQNQ